MAPVDDIWATTTTYRVIHQAFEWAAVGTLKIDGESGPVEVYGWWDVVACTIGSKLGEIGGFRLLWDAPRNCGVCLMFGRECVAEWARLRR